MRLALLPLGIALGLLVCEVALRLLWTDYPVELNPRADREVVAITGDPVPRRIKPGVRRSYYTRYRLNSRGYRGPEHTPRKQRGQRIAVVGDSFVFGVAVSDSDTIPARLQTQLRAAGHQAEVINVGYPASGLAQNLGNTARVIKDYRPDLVLLVLFSNDFAEVLHMGDSFPPPFLPELHRRPGQPAWPGRLGQLMLPRQMIRHAPGDDHSAGRWLARRSRAWLYAALMLHAAGTSNLPPDRQLPYLLTDSYQVEELIWQRLGRSLDRLRALARAGGARPLLVLFTDFTISGLAAQRVEAAAGQAGVALLDLSPLWQDREHFKRHHSLVWNDHPNAAANSEAARTVGSWLAANGWLNSPASSAQLQRHRQHQRSLAARHVLRRAQASRQRQQQRALRATFRAALRPGAPGAASAAPMDQWLHGWWHPHNITWHRGQGRWMSASGAVLLRAPPGGATALKLEGRLPPPYDAGPVPFNLLCHDHLQRQVLRLDRERFQLQLKLSRPIPGEKVAECRLWTETHTTAQQAGIQHGWQSQISLLLTHISLEAQ